MIHEIYPHIFNGEFKICKAKSTDYVIRYNGMQTLLKKCGDVYKIPTVGELQCDCKKSTEDFCGHYLFNIDAQSFFIDDSECNFVPPGYEYVANRTFRGMNPVERMGGATAAHIAHWESLNKFCGRCGNKMQLGTTERSLICTKCKNIVYPRISPVVIVAVSNGNKLLMAHNLDNPNPKRFLISGFVEIGESLEQAAVREVKEETGLTIKNIRYFGSQPWPFSDSLIAGFTAELDGSDVIHIQKSELSEAVWVNRSDIPEYKTDVSISCCLIEHFRRGYEISK